MTEPAGAERSPARSLRKPRVAVYREQWLSGSETFIRDHVDNLVRYRGVAVGLGRVDSPLARGGDRIVQNRPPSRLRVRRRLAKATGVSPGLARVLRLIDPDLVHVHFANDAMHVLGSIGRLGRRVPVVVTCHGVDVNRLPRRPGRRGRRYRHRLARVFDRAAALIAVSEFIAGRLRELGADPGKIVVIPSGVSVPPASSDDDAARPYDLVFVGRLIEIKGVDDLLTAAALVEPHPRILIVGDGDQRPALERRTIALGLDVTFTGHLSPQGVRTALRSARVNVLPARRGVAGDEEALSVTLLEAGALGVPSIATRIGGIPEALPDGVGGLLVAERSGAELAEAIRRLLRDGELRKLLGAGARRHVAEGFERARMLERLEDLYDQLLTADKFSDT